MAEIPGLSTFESAELYQTFEKQAREAGVQPAYAVEQEMDMRLHQIKPTADTASLAALQKLGYAYYVKIEVEGKEAEETYSHATAEEVAEARQKMAQGVVQRAPDPTKARLTFSLYTTDERRLIYSQVTTTEMSSLPLPENDGDQSSVNLSSAAMAIQKAMTKGTKKLLANCK